MGAEADGIRSRGAEGQSLKDCLESTISCVRRLIKEPLIERCERSWVRLVAIAARAGDRRGQVVAFERVAKGGFASRQVELCCGTVQFSPRQRSVRGNQAPGTRKDFKRTPRHSEELLNVLATR